MKDSMTGRIMDLNFGSGEQLDGRQKDAQNKQVNMIIGRSEGQG